MARIVQWCSLGCSMTLITSMSLFCIVGSKKKKLVSVFVLLYCQNSSAESVQRQNMKALNTHTHTRTRICTHSQSLSQTHTVHLPLPFSNAHILKYRHTAPFGHIFSLLRQGVLFDLSPFECAFTVCACVLAHIRGLHVHTRSPKQNISVYLRLDSYPSMCIFQKVLSSFINNWEINYRMKLVKLTAEALMLRSYKHWKPIRWVRGPGSMTEENPVPPFCHQQLQSSLKDS